MGVSIEQWRAKIGCFHPRRLERKFKMSAISITSRSVMVTVRVFLLLALLLCGDVELNPGPPKENPRVTRSGSIRDYATNTGARVKSPMASTARDQALNKSQPRIDCVASSPGLNSPFGAFDRFGGEQNDILSKLNHITAKLDKLDVIEEKLDTMKTKIDDLEKENTLLKEQVGNLENKVDYLEGQSKRNNIIIHGLNEEGRNESWASSERKVRDFLNVNLGIPKTEVDNMSIERAHRMKRPPGVNRPIVTKFLNYKDCERVLEASKETRQNNPHQHENIRVTRDYSAKIRETRSRLWPHLDQARKDGHIAYMSYDKLVINNIAYVYDQDTDTIVRPYRGGQLVVDTPGEL